MTDEPDGFWKMFWTSVKTDLRNFGLLMVVVLIIFLFFAALKIGGVE